MMKKLTLSALAAVAVVGTSFAGPCPVVSKEFKQPCVTPCFRDQEFQLDLFYSYNDASHQGSSSVSDTFTSAPFTTPVAPGFLPTRTTNILNDPAIIPPGSVVVDHRNTNVSVPQYFNDGSGGGVGLNYFFARYFGVGVEGNWWDGCRGGFTGETTARDLVGLPAGVDPVAVAAAARAAGVNATAVDPTTVLLRARRSLGDNNRDVANQVTGSLILRYPFEGPICWAPYIFGGGGGIFDGKSTGFGHVGFGVEFRVTPYMGFFSDWRWEFMSGHNGDNGWRDNGRIRELVDTFGVRNFDDFDNKKRNDVGMTRVGVRFVF